MPNLLSEITILSNDCWELSLETSLLLLHTLSSLKLNGEYLCLSLKLSTVGKAISKS